MKKINQVIIVNHDSLQNRELEKTIGESGIASNIRIAVNGGHAFLHISQLHLNGKINDGPILVLLNLNTPMVNGFEFLNEFNETKDLKKETIQIVVIDQDLSAQQKARAQKLGISYFVSISCPADLLKLISPGNAAAVAA